MEKLRTLGPGGKETRRPSSSEWLVDGTLVEPSDSKIAWTPLGGARHEAVVDLDDCDRRLVAGARGLVLLAGKERNPGEEGKETWRAVRIDAKGQATLIGELAGHPYDAAPWKDGVAVLRGRRFEYGDVDWDIVLLAPGAAPLEAKLPMQPQYNLMWGTGFSIAADGDLVAVGNHERLAVYDVAKAAWIVSDGTTD